MESQRVMQKITARRDPRNGFWSSRVEMYIDGVYAGIVWWKASQEVSYTSFRKSADHWLPSLKAMRKIDRYNYEYNY